MVIQFEADEGGSKKVETGLETLSPNIKVLGIGGAGCSIISRIYSENWSHVNFVVCDSSIRALSGCEGAERVLLGKSLIRGWGTGGDKDLAKRVTQEAEDKIRTVLNDAEILILVCSLGKGLGAGASPIVLRVARETETLSIGFFILPFSFEGRERITGSQEALGDLWQLVDGAVVVSNDALLGLEKASEESSLSLREVFTKVDSVFEDLLQLVNNVFYHQGVIGLDFADIKSFLARGKRIIITTGEGDGEGCVEEAVRKVLYSPIWGKISFSKTKGALLVIRAGEEFRLNQLKKIILSLREKINFPIPITFGVYTQEGLSDKIILTLMVSKAPVLESKTGPSEKFYQQELGLKVYDQKDLDVPTFLRKQHN